jgi:small conductance mechanosensitive channel
MNDVDWATIWQSLVNFAVTYEAPLRIVGVIVGAVILRWILLISILRVVDRVVYGVKKAQNVENTTELSASPLHAVRVVQRTRTMGSVMRNLVTWAIVSVGVVLILSELNFSVTALIASAGVLGAALGFGAQSVIKDMLNGLFMVFEDQLGVGDVVDLGEAVGMVENVGVRVTQVRDIHGTLWFVRNGEILRVGNKSQGWARVIIDLPVPYTSDVHAVEEVMLATAIGLANDPAWKRKSLETPEIWGIESLSAEALVVRLVMKVRTADQWDVARELRLRLKLALDEMGVSLPALNRVVMDGLDRPAPRRNAPRTRPIPVSDEDSTR